MNPDNSTNLAEMLEGAGRPDSFAALVLEYLQLFTPHGHCPLSEKNFFFIDGLLSFLLELTDSDSIVFLSLISAGAVR
jgi:hypothetical protein